MKKLTIFILLLLSSAKLLACGYTPYGEDVRYCLLHPKYFNFEAYQSFNYSANLWGFQTYYEEYRPNYYESNILDWYNFTQKRVSIEEIGFFNDQLRLSDIHPQSSNGFLKYLYKNKKTEVIRYLEFSKKCEDFNALQSEDVWERDSKINISKGNDFFKKLEAAYEEEKSTYLKRKYAFQCIRFAFYLGDMQAVARLFEKEFKNSTKDYLYYWSLYFTCFTKSNAENGVDIASIFANSPEKANAAYYFFHSDYSFKKALAKAQTKPDIANVYAYISSQITDKNLDNLKTIYANNPNLKVLDFLLLREINKLEDWIYTPYYSNYLPSIQESKYYWSNSNDEINTIMMRERSEKDRLYAQEVLNFVDVVDFSKVNNVVIWKAAQIQLLFMTRQFDECLTAINDFQKKYPAEKVTEEIEQIKALCLTANQTYGKAVIKEEVEKIFLKYSDNDRFVFALGRELEFLGNLPDGMAVVSFVNKEKNAPEYYYSESPGIEWQGNRLKTTGNLSYFYEYFDYLDFVYPAKDLQIIVNKLNGKFSSSFEAKLYKYLWKDKNYLKDLLGTKYLRENQLELALHTFKSIPQKYWNDNYNPWEKDRFGEWLSFDSNPFYSFKYTEEFIPHKEKFIVTKLSVTEHLIQFLQKADNPKTADRDYYYFLVANCFYNMTEFGNSWMMRRYQSSTNYNLGYYDVSYVDEREYRTKVLSQKYYRLAFENAKTDKFKALCLRMMDFAHSNYPNDFKKLKYSYPQFYSDLSNCDNLKYYFKSRR